MSEARLGPILEIDSTSDRWGSAADAGFVQIPNVLIKRQAELCLSANDMVVLLNLLLHWWFRDRYPFPRSSVIAKRTGLGLRTVQRCLNRLEIKGLIKRERRPDEIIQYNLSGLQKALAEKAQNDTWFRPEVAHVSDIIN